MEQKFSKRTRFNRMCIGESLLELMKEKEFDRITIKELVEKAGISRVTYYHYYYDKSDVLRDYLNEIVSAYMNQSEGWGNFHRYEHVLQALTFFDQYAEFFLILESAGLFGMIMDAVNQFLMEQILEQYPISRYELSFYGGALLNTFLQWEKRGKDLPAEEIAAVLAHKER